MVRLGSLFFHVFIVVVAETDRFRQRIGLAGEQAALIIAEGGGGAFLVGERHHAADAVVAGVDGRIGRGLAGLPVAVAVISQGGDHRFAIGGGVGQAVAVIAGFGADRLTALRIDGGAGRVVIAVVSVMNLVGQWIGDIGQAELGVIGILRLFAERVGDQVEIVVAIVSKSSTVATRIGFGNDMFLAVKLTAVSVTKGVFDTDHIRLPVEVVNGLVPVCVFLDIEIARKIEIISISGETGVPGFSSTTRWIFLLLMDRINSKHYLLCSRGINMTIAERIKLLRQERK